MDVWLHRSFPRLRKEYINVGENEASIDKFVAYFYQGTIEFWHELRDVMLLKSFDRLYTPYFLKRAVLMNNDRILSYFELRDFLEDLCNHYSIQTIDAEIYIILHKCLKKYTSFKKPKSDIAKYLLHNVMIEFRDLLRVQYRFMQIKGREVELSFEHEAYASHGFNEIGELLTTSNWVCGIKLKAPKMVRYEYFLRLHDDLDSYKITRRLNISHTAMNGLVNKAKNYLNKVKKHLSKE